ncbi:hypothetical protein BT69DRAFT_1344196 [Atractiella rhizophila]|nr:hypothetical protein BT69DRAFT_1344196 [Atractiella rhizophila]
MARDNDVISITPISGFKTFCDPWTLFAGDLAHLHWKNNAELIFDSTMGINKQESLPEPWHPTQQVREEFGNMLKRSKVDIPYDFSQAAPLTPSIRCTSGGTFLIGSLFPVFSFSVFHSTSYMFPILLFVAAGSYGSTRLASRKGSESGSSTHFPMEGMIGFLKKQINQDNKYQENLLNQALLLEQMNIVDIPYPAPNVIHGNAGSQYRCFSSIHSHNSVYSPRWALISLTKLVNCKAPNTAPNGWSFDLNLVRLLQEEPLWAGPGEEIVAKSWKFEARKVCRYEGIDDAGETFYGEAVVYLRVPETFFDPEASPAADKLFAVTQLFSKRRNFFESEILCQ